MNIDEHRSWLQDLRRRVAELRSNPNHQFINTPISVDRGSGVAVDTSVEGVALLVLILFMLIAGVVLVFTQGVLFWVAGGLALFAGVFWVLLIMRTRKPLAEWQRSCEVYGAALVMANSALFQEGKMDLPGLMVVSFADLEHGDHERLAACAERVYALLERNPQQLNGEENAVRDWVGDQRAHYDRLKVPVALAGDDSTWLVGMRLSRRAMRLGKLDQKMWPVLARPGRNESAELLPHSITA